MKPKDLQPPFTWDSPFVTIDDGLFYTFEKENSNFSFPDWSDPSVFGNHNPVKIEYCSGNGYWIAEQAAKEKDANWVAIEKRFVRMRKVWAKKKNHLLKNLFGVCGEALHVTKAYFPPSSVEEVYVNFPDPWPKKKHAKYRLIQSPFIDEINRILKEGGFLVLVTDDLVYSGQMIEVLLSHSNFSSVFPSPFYVTDWPGYGGSYFDSLWREKGKEIRYHKFVKKRENK